MSLLPKYTQPSNFPFYVISAQNASHRPQHILEELESRGIQYSWQNASLGGFDEIDEYIGRACLVDGYQTLGWEFAECLVHLRLMHRMLAEQDEVQVVLTDDVLFNDEDGDFMARLNGTLAQLPSDWEVFWLSTDVNASKYLDYSGYPIKHLYEKEQLFYGPVGSGVYGVHHADTNRHALVYRRQFAQKVLANQGLYSDFGALIKDTLEIHGGQNAYVAFPPLVQVQHLFPTAFQGSKREYLVLAVSGDISQVSNWLKDFDEQSKWDLALLYYGGNPYHECPQCIAVNRQAGAKFNLIYQFMNSAFWQEAKHQYKAIMITDDDLIMDVHSLNIAFDVFTRYGLKLAQQSVCRAFNSYCMWDHLFQRSETLLRYTTWVEIMAPIFEANVFNTMLKHTLDGAYTGMGLDTVWPRLLKFDRKGIAVIDAVCMAHPKMPLKSMAGRKRIYNELPINQQEEERKTLQKYKLTLADVGRIVRVFTNVTMKSFLEGQGSPDQLYYKSHRNPMGLEQLTQLLNPMDKKDADPPPVTPKKRSGLAFLLVAGAASIVAMAVVALIISKSPPSPRLPRIASGIKALHQGWVRRRSDSAQDINLEGEVLRGLPLYKLQSL